MKLGLLLWGSIALVGAHGDGNYSSYGLKEKGRNGSQDPLSPLRAHPQ
jgi:hypothetical protein